MAAPLNPEFQAYLESIANKYQHWCNRYTLTDAEDRQRKENQFSPFDFGLMVQTLQPKQSPGTSCEEKTEEREILPVLNGVRKYVDDHVLLVGRPGSGKSTALARLLWEEA
jgi:predicted NACHT family NTPase